MKIRENLKNILLFFGLFCCFFGDVFAARKMEEKDYYASLRSDKTNVRAGPGQHYPVKFTYQAKFVPVRIISEYDNWNEIEDFEGQTGWVSQSLLTKRRSLMVQTSKEAINMYSRNNPNSRVIFRLENHVIGEYLTCQDKWCEIRVKDKKGWVARDNVFGAGQAQGG